MTLQRLRGIALTAVLASAMASSASAQTTLKLTNSSATTLRGGEFATSVHADELVIETRSSDDEAYERRGLLKFDTHTTTSASTPITSATLTLTVAGGNSEARKLSAFHVPSSYDEAYVTWTHRKSGITWSEVGGDAGTRYAVAPMTSTSGSKVTFDVTTMVQAIVRGDFGSSRYTRILLIDEGSSSRGSYKKLHSDEAADPSARPVLTIVTGTGTAPVTDPDAPDDPDTIAPGTGTTMRVLHWNLHHGGFGTDGKYDTNRVATWMAKMKPDVIMLNEIEKYTGWGNQNQPEVYKQLMESKTGLKWYYLFAQEYGNWTSNGKGNMILSTVPFDDTALYEMIRNGDRSIGQVIIRWNNRPITFMVTHLDHESYDLRLVQAKEVTAWAAVQPENQILTGDMNAWPDQSSIKHLDTFFYDSWEVATAKGTATSFAGNNGETKKGRIDYIYYSRKSAGLVVKSSQVYDTRDANGVMPSDHRPLVTTFEVK